MSDGELRFLIGACAFLVLIAAPFVAARVGRKRRTAAKSKNPAPSPLMLALYDDPGPFNPGHRVILSDEGERAIQEPTAEERLHENEDLRAGYLRDTVIKRALDLHRCGEISYTRALELAVVNLSVEREQLASGELSIPPFPDAWRCRTCRWWDGPDEDDGLGECSLTETDKDILWGDHQGETVYEHPESLAHVSLWGVSADGGDAVSLCGALLTGPDFGCNQELEDFAGGEGESKE